VLGALDGQEGGGRAEAVALQLLDAVDNSRPASQVCVHVGYQLAGTEQGLAERKHASVSRAQHITTSPVILIVMAAAT